MAHWQPPTLLFYFSSPATAFFRRATWVKKNKISRLCSDCHVLVKFSTKRVRVTRPISKQPQFNIGGSPIVQKRSIFRNFRVLGEYYLQLRYWSNASNTRTCITWILPYVATNFCCIATTSHLLVFFSLNDLIEFFWKKSKIS